MHRYIPLILSLATMACDDPESFDELECTMDIVEFAYDDQASWPAGDNACDGVHQSPIDVDTTISVENEAPTLIFDYSTTPLFVGNNGHSLEYEVDHTTNKLVVGGAEYDLLQFHFHSPSEHTIDGQHFPLEMHLVHKKGNDLAVVAIMFDEGDTEQPWFAGAHWSELPTEAGTCTEDEAVTLNMADLIENQLSDDATDVMHYTGSLTTPPCTEGVEWFIMGRYGTLSAAQIDTFTALYDGNNRDVQPIGDRTLSYDADYGQ